MTVSLSMIVKNEAANLEACIGPLRDVVDEIVVVDTGSADDTRSIAQRLGARVFEFPWCDSFAAARNHAIEQATCDWVLILDADDRVVPPEKEKLRTLFATLGSENVGYMIGSVSLGPDGGVGIEAEQVRLFPRRPDLRFRYRVHEQIVPAIDEACGAYERTNVRLVHVGYRDASIDAKVARNLRLVEMDCADMPHDPFPAFYRGVMLSQLGRHTEAIVCLELCRSRVLPGSAMARTLSSGLARSQRAEGDFFGALETLRSARVASPCDAALALLEAEMLIEAGDVTAAAECLLEPATREARDLTTDDLQLRVLFAETLLVLGHHEAAAQTAQDVVRRRPAFGLPWLVIADALLVLGKDEDLDAMLGALGTIRGADTAHAAIRAARCARAGKLDEAFAVIEPLLEAHPSDRLLTALRARLRTGGGAQIPLASCLSPLWAPSKKTSAMPSQRGVMFAIQ